MSETPYMRRVLNTAHKAGMWLFRNNVGLFYTRDGRPVRCGLGTGTSDLIGWTRYIVRAEDVGRTLAVFTAIETKSAKGRLRPEQQNFIDAVRESGGIASPLRAGQDIETELAALAGMEGMK